MASMGRVTRATRAELRKLGAKPAADALATVAIDLAERLDSDPGPRDAVGLSRELRLAMDALRQRHDGTGGEHGAFLGSVAAPDLQQPGD